jgi:hypothetical protein
MIFNDGDKHVATMRIFYWGIKAPSGRTYSKDVAEAIVDSINETALMASFAEVLNINLVSGIVTDAEIKGNVVYAKVGLLGDTTELLPEEEWVDGAFRCGVVLNLREGAPYDVTMEDVVSISHILIYRTGK